jgi:hypothetical protein
VVDRVLFGSDFPVIGPAEAQQVLMGLGSLLPGMPPIAEEVLAGLIHRRPLSLLDAGAPVGVPRTECC